MGIEDLTQIQLVDGIIGLIYPAVGTLIGTIIASKYIKYKRRELLFVGLSLILLTLSWLALGLTFITMVFFDFILPDIIYFLLYLGFTPISIFCWMWAMAILLAPNHIKKIVSIYGVISISYEIYLFVILFTDPYSILIRVSPMRTDATTPVFSLFALFALFSALITILF